jgi:hypothetical protein
VRRNNLDVPVLDLSLARAGLPFRADVL